MGARGYLRRLREGSNSKLSESIDVRFIFGRRGDWPLRMAFSGEINALLGWTGFRDDLVQLLMNMLSRKDARALASVNRRLSVLGERFFASVCAASYGVESRAVLVWVGTQNFAEEKQFANVFKLSLAVIEPMADRAQRADEMEFMKVSALFFQTLWRLRRKPEFNFDPFVEKNLLDAESLDYFQADAIFPSDSIFEEEYRGDDEEPYVRVNVMFPFASMDYWGAINVTKSHAMQLLRVCKHILSRDDCLKFLFEEQTFSVWFELLMNLHFFLEAEIPFNADVMFSFQIN